MMCFDMNFCNFAIKQGAKAMGAGVHHKTNRAYVFFNKNDLKFQQSLSSWNKK